MPLRTDTLDEPQLNLTPMIDIVFLLIIFFMVGTRFTGDERKIKVQLPTVGSAASLTSAPQKRVVQVFADGSVQVDDDRMSITELTDSLKNSVRQNPAVSVAVRGDADGPFQNVASVLAACRTAGIQDMAVSVRLSR